MSDLIPTEGCEGPIPVIPNGLCLFLARKILLRPSSSAVIEKRLKDLNLHFWLRTIIKELLHYNNNFHTYTDNIRLQESLGCLDNLNDPQKYIISLL